MFSHSQHLAQHVQRITRLLQRLAQNDEIKGLVRVVRKSVVDVALVGRYSAGDGSPDLIRINLHTASIDSLLLLQRGQQLSFAAT